MSQTVHDAVMVGSVAVGESDLVIRLLTPDRGRVACFARGARSARRGLGAALQIGVRLRVQLRAGRGDLTSLRDVEVRQSPVRARDAIEGIAWLTYGIEVCGGLATEDGESTRLFGLLEAWLDRLEEPAGPDRSRMTGATRVALEAKALTFAGLTPRLVSCAVCGGALDAMSRFDTAVGGAAHASCSSGGPRVATEELTVLEGLRRTPLATLGQPAIAPAARWLLSDFIQYQLGRALQSRSLLQEVEPW